MTACFSDDRKYRYLLHRRLGNGTQTCIFIMLNPSTADEEKDDATIRRCKSFAIREGCANLYVVNLFAVCATNPAEMMAADDPVGPHNKDYISKILYTEHPSLVICAWGSHGGFMEQDQEVMGWIEDYAPRCFGVTAQGFPRHPLYLPKNALLHPYKGRRYRPVGDKSVLVTP
jgi:hypothetical protein